MNNATRNNTRALEWPVETEVVFLGFHPAFRCRRGPGTYLYSCDYDGKNFQKALTAFHIIFNLYMYMCALVRVVRGPCVVC